MFLFLNTKNLIGDNSLKFTFSIKKYKLFIAKLLLYLFFLSVSLLISNNISAWEQHPLITQLLVESMPELMNAEPVPAEPLEDFLIDIEEKLPELIIQIDTWAKYNVAEYSPTPVDLYFIPTGNKDDIKKRFTYAIRINPNIKTPLYTLAFADNPPENRRLLNINDVCVVNFTYSFMHYCFPEVQPGEKVSPKEILIAGVNEPDYGMDVGLFEDNGTEYGAVYGFGPQPFGGIENVDITSQGPFHMLFANEQALLALFGNILNRTFAEYRIYTFKELSKLAFDTGHKYWGWRFMSWGLHYIEDLTMPYHTTPLPNHDIWDILWMLIQYIFGNPEKIMNAVTICAKRHLAIETFMGSLFLDAVKNQHDPFGVIQGFYNGSQFYLNWNFPDPGCGATNNIKFCIIQEGIVPEYTDDLPKRCISLYSYLLAGVLDDLISQTIPDKFVNDPIIDQQNVNDWLNIVNLTISKSGFNKVKQMVDIANASMFLSNYYGKSFIAGILNYIQSSKINIPTQ